MNSNKTPNNLKDKLLKYFLRYTAVPSQSDESVDAVPSTEGQWELARLLAEDLKELDLQDIQINDYSVVQAFLPARLKDNSKKVPAIAWIAHLDTVDVGLSPEIKAKVHENYQGGDICQNEEKGIYIKVEEHPELLKYIGQDILISDGTSVLGADNKAAIANLMSMLEVVQENPEIEHGDIYIAFVPDEEIGLRGARKIDYENFPVDYAYTIDCCELGEIVYETFNAGSGTLNIQGVSAHPMSSKGNLVNPIMVAHDFISLLNRGETPEYTEKTEGYIWVTDIHSDVLQCTVTLNIRDHNKEKYEAKKQYLEEAAKLVQLKHPKAKINLELTDVYGNIADSVTEENRQCIDDLYQAFEELEIDAKTIAMRGGTDGSFISTKGILTPNYFTGAHNFHSVAEFLPMDSFEKACLVTLKLIEISTRD